jgi:cysteine desulfurase
MPIIDLDHNATTPLGDAARDAWLQVQSQAGGNPNSTHAHGQAARVALDRARQQLARLLGCRPHELVCCGSGTEANALAVHAALAARGGQQRILTTAIEHSSVLRQADRPQDVVLPVQPDGRLDPAVLAQELRPQDALFACQYANNETGVRQDLPALVAVCRERAPQMPILVDLCQGVGKEAIALAQLGVDLASFSAHKFGGPKGVGFLWVRSGFVIQPLIRGGRQQQDRRSGTEDVAGVAAAAAALAAVAPQLEVIADRHRRWLEAAWQTISAALPTAIWAAHGAPRLANTMNLLHPGIPGEALITRLDLAGFAVSPGSACMAARGEPSHVIAALGHPPEVARSAVRVSLGHATTGDQVQAFAAAYVREVEALLSRRR